MNYVWKKWWRAVEGVVSQDKGFSFKSDSDYWYFDVDPEIDWNEQIPEEGDSRYMHVDDLFTNKEDATKAAEEWCLEQESELIDKMDALGMWNGNQLFGGDVEAGPGQDY